MQKQIFFVTGIDTDAGKTFATGMIAKMLHQQNKSVITQKLAQTGCSAVSSDIVDHRRLMGVELFAEDKDGTTCPFLFSFPCSPHLAAQIDGKDIDVQTIDNSTKKLLNTFDIVLIEGAGGLYVPINQSLFTIDFIKERNYPLILVSSAKLGSINHTLLSLEACKKKGINVIGVIYNHYPQTPEVIFNDSHTIIKDYTKQMYPHAFFEDLPIIQNAEQTLNFQFC